MCVSNDIPLDIFKWGDRLLYAVLFISCIIVMGYWDTIITYTFLGSIFALTLPMLFYKEEILEQSDKSMMVCTRDPIIDLLVCETHQNNLWTVDLYRRNHSKKPSCSTHDTLAKSEGCSQGFLGCGLRLSKMETENAFNQLQQDTIRNIASQAFIRGKIEGLRNLADYFHTFSAKTVSVEDLHKSIEGSILLLQEGLK